MIRARLIMSTEYLDQINLDWTPVTIQHPHYASKYKIGKTSSSVDSKMHYES